MSVTKKTLFIITFGVILLGVSALLSEAALRLVYPMPWYGYLYLAPHKHMFRHDPLIGWVGRPNTDDVFASMDFKHTVHHDANGFRNQHAFLDPAKRNYLILGDSFAWGWGVYEDETVSAVLTKRDNGVNAYNISAPGWGTDQEYLLLKRFLDNHPNYRPDAVVLLFFCNDFEDNVEPIRYGYPKPMFKLQPDNRMVLTGVPVPNDRSYVFDGKREVQKKPRTAWRSSHLFNLIDYFYQNGTLPHLKKYPSHPPTPLERHQVRIAATLIGMTNAMIKGRGSKLFVIFVFPSGDQRFPVLGRLLDKESIPNRNFKRTVIPRNELWHDHHVNAWGYRNMATMIEDWVDERSNQSADE